MPLLYLDCPVATFSATSIIGYLAKLQNWAAFVILRWMLSLFDPIGIDTNQPLNA